MRLIDADALREQIDDYKYFHSSFQKMTVAEFLTIVHELIDNAPIVFSCNACKNMGNERECVDCHDYSNYVHYEKRPQGEWIDEGQYAEGHSEHAYFCKNCNYEIIEKPNTISENRFCKNCGADMRKGDDNDG